MNDILHIKGIFEPRGNPSTPGAPKLSSTASLSVAHLEKLKADLESVSNSFLRQSKKIVDGAMVSIYYNKVVAKSNRTSALFKPQGGKSNDTIVGAKYSDDGKHIITHYVTHKLLNKAINLLDQAIDYTIKYFKDPITPNEFNNKEKFEDIKFNKTVFSKSTFQTIIVDCSYINSFGIEYPSFDVKKDSVVTFYKTESKIDEIFKKINLSIPVSKILDQTTVVLTKEEIEILLENIPYLISMAVEDLSTYSPSDFHESYKNETITIPKPKDEPTIGVIDTLFDDRVYFSEWVDYHQLVSNDIATEKDKTHGTRVSSIIVDGHRLNPQLDDGCGHFKVRHFGVATAGRYSSITIMREIKKIVINNPDIRVWNLSLGSNEEIHRNFVSIEAAALDELQYEQDIIFVIAGTNDNQHLQRKIGAPADSINAAVVNSVKKNREPALYARKGPVLDFFTKPDISYYGGTSDNPLRACDGNGEALVAGTSYASPWIARKLSYLIDVLGFNREIAKAMIIDSAVGWHHSTNVFTGHGIVPIKIDEIVKSKKDEIRFVLSGVSTAYETYNYRFPIPFYKNEYPFIARATLCYFPKCSRSQGVDYTNTELDLYFGRINDENKLKSINNNKQSSNEGPVDEETSRKEFGKWDNVKHIQDKSVSSPKPKKVYIPKLWGMKIVSKDRLGYNDGLDIRFGVVVTLKELNGINRIEDFIQLFSLNGWIVNRIDIKSRINIYEKAEETIEFE